MVQGCWHKTHFNSGKQFLNPSERAPFIERSSLLPGKLSMAVTSKTLPIGIEVDIDGGGDVKRMTPIGHTGFQE